MSIQISHDHRPGPLTRLLAILISVLIAFALFGFAVLIWVLVVLVEDPAATSILGAIAGLR